MGDKAHRTIWTFFIAVFCAVGVFLMTGMNVARQKAPPILPIKTMKFSVAAESREKYLETLKAFAEGHSLRYTMEPTGQRPQTYYIDILGSDVWLLGDSLFDPLKFQIGFYPPPGGSVNTERVMSVAGSLASSISTVPGVSIDAN
jgi:hypothetical protein